MNSSQFLQIHFIKKRRYSKQNGSGTKIVIKFEIEIMNLVKTLGIVIVK